MNAIICLDDKNGMLFNKRRQSRDSVLTERVLKLAEGNKLFVSTYSAKLFGENTAVTVVDNPLNSAQSGDFCFIESAVETLANVTTLYVFRWNRHYPADTFFTLDIEKEGFKLVSTEDFAGSSHEKITLEVYSI